MPKGRPKKIKIETKIGDITSDVPVLGGRILLEARHAHLTSLLEALRVEGIVSGDLELKLSKLNEEIRQAE